MNYKEISFYILVGAFATAVDWTTFTIGVKSLNLPYQLSLVMALCIGGLAHYFANKTITFRCRSRNYRSQLTLYVLMAILTLLCSMAILSTLIKFFGINKVYARMFTTGVMIFPNYLLHKYLTFNKRIFIQPIKT